MNGTGADPRRWITLGILVSAALIVALDTTVLNVAIPTILREFHTDLNSLQWVISGYSLTFATFLIIGGRLGDIYGARNTFMVGAALFGVGSLIASIATNVPQLVVGEAIIEGIGASLMMPATLSLISNTFQGRERATAFAAWGAVIGAAVAFGPLVGGYFTTYHSWRWSFRINVIMAPLAILGAWFFMRPPATPERRQRLDIPGAILIAIGMFALVFGLSEGSLYGWWRPTRDFDVGGATVWSRAQPVSINVAAFVISVITLTVFVFYERRKERRRADPLFEFGELRHPAFRYGLITIGIVAMGQLGFLFVLPVFLQEAKHLSAMENGAWLIPSGVMIMIGAQIGGRVARRTGPTIIVRIGLVAQTVALPFVGLSLSPSMTFWDLLPSLALFSFGLGLATSQLTNVVLSEIQPEKSGSASGANTTVRQIGAALGIAVIGPLLSVRTVNAMIDALHSSGLAESVKHHALALVGAQGVNYRPPAGTAAADAAQLRHMLEQAVTTGAKPTFLYASVVVGLGTVASFLIPRLPPAPASDDDIGLELAQTLDVIDPVDIHRPPAG